jgi:hypothetical protein
MSTTKTMTGAATPVTRTMPTGRPNRELRLRPSVNSVLRDREKVKFLDIHSRVIALADFALEQANKARMRALVAQDEQQRARALNQAQEFAAARQSLLQAALAGPGGERR